MTNATKVLGFLVGVLAIGLVIVNGRINSIPAPATGGIYETNVKYFRAGLKAGSADQFAVSATGAVTAQSLALSNSSATSTATIGCVNGYATSSATAVYQKYLAVATTSSNGFVTWAYGSCP